MKGGVKSQILRYLKYLDFFERDKSERILRVTVAVMSLPFFVLPFVPLYSIKLVAHIILVVVFPVLGFVGFGQQLKPKKLSQTGLILIYVWLKGVSVVLFFGSLLYLAPLTNLSDATKTLLNPDRVVTVQGQITHQCTGPHCRLAGTNIDFRLDTGEEIEVQCRYYCHLKNDGHYELTVTPDKYLLLDAKEISS